MVLQPKPHVQNYRYSSFPVCKTCPPIIQIDKVDRYRSWGLYLDVSFWTGVDERLFIDSLWTFTLSALGDRIRT